MAGKQQTPEEALESLLVSMDPVDVLAEYSEIGVDALLSDGVLRDIPVVSSILAIGRLGIAIRDRMLLKSILQFISAQKTITPEQRRQMVDKLEHSPDYGRNVGEHVIELLERIDSHKKPLMVGLVFASCARAEIGADTLSKLCFAIEYLPAHEIRNVRAFFSASDSDRFKMKSEAKQTMAFAGLAVMGSAYGGLVHVPTDICAEFVRLDLDRV